MKGTAGHITQIAEKFVLQKILSHFLYSVRESSDIDI